MAGSVDNNGVRVSHNAAIRLGRRSDVPAFIEAVKSRDDEWTDEMKPFEYQRKSFQVWRCGDVLIVQT